VSISEPTLKAIVNAGERADDLVRQAARLPQTIDDLDEAPLARGLGWFSIGLGLAEALAPQAMARAIGAPGYEGTVRAFGLREIATGVGILASGNRPPGGWLWARAGGDAMDLAFLGIAAGSPRANPARLALAAAAVAGVAVADVLCAQRLDEK
jgi:hypothetical protein